ncbi:histidinol-phosphate transaminase [Acetohalobium arabaticum]|uniref:Histidinol-phosphate aminotransferase n=1 Tax=Acetohalobium arabaticum (strain ATCC 49924 / DSM 5501 / Z-7288) TaxID=574087 RepID=D9QQD9_ACEAZ|nr:histidinol-phosphate transaminase [Acetohalobium arabaticum]ADL12730.1 histidinol-phosphate aminotransferase [Acetohalobium arabaticum DSM 5501]
MVDEIRETIKNVSPYAHGKTIKEIKEEYGLDKVAKLCFNENPYAPYPNCLSAIKNEFENLNYYADADYIELKELIGERLGFAKKNIALSHGAVGILEILSKIFIQKGNEVIIPESTYGLYEDLSRSLGAVVKKAPLVSDKINVEVMLDKITPETKLIWLCNPHNPTGTIIKDSEFKYFLDQVPEDVWIIVDEAYYEFTDAEELPDTTATVKEGENIILVRTFSKAYGMAGLRLGYALADQEIIRAIKQASQPFNANKAAIAGAKAVLKDDSYFKKAVNKINDSKEYLISELKKMNYQVLPSYTNFVFFRTSYPADEITNELLQNGVMVASGSRWNCDKGIRVSIGKPEENQKFLQELKRAGS